MAIAQRGDFASITRSKSKKITKALREALLRIEQVDHKQWGDVCGLTADVRRALQDRKSPLKIPDMLEPKSWTPPVVRFVKRMSGPSTPIC